MLRHFLEELLSDSGYRVLSADSVPAAVAMIAGGLKDIAGLITDIELGNRLTGWDLARHARSLNPNLGILYMSGRCGHQWASEGVPDSIFLQKPFAAVPVLNALSAVLGRDKQDMG